MIYNIAKWWLVDGAKYSYSKFRAGTNWNVKAPDALKPIGISLDDCVNMYDVVNKLRGKIFWKPDGVFQIDDYVKSPPQVVKDGGDDCDGMAMFHAQCLEHVLGKKGWKCRIASYLANPFFNSHHFCILTEPSGNKWAVQPQLTVEQYAKFGKNVNIIFGPYKTDEEVVNAIAAQYNSTVVFFDIRDSSYERV